MIEVEMDMDGNTAIFEHGKWTKLAPGDYGDIELTKIGRKATIRTWNGIVVSQAVNTVDIRVPGFYNDITYGLCGNNNKDKTDDYMTKDGQILEYNPGRGYQEQVDK